MDTRAFIVLPDGPKLEVLTKELELTKRLTRGENVFMRTASIGTYDPPDCITFACVINYWLIDANTPMLSQK